MVDYGRLNCCSHAVHYMCTCYRAWELEESVVVLHACQAKFFDHFLRTSLLASGSSICGCCTFRIIVFHGSFPSFSPVSLVVAVSFRTYKVRSNSSLWFYFEQPFMCSARRYGSGSRNCRDRRKVFLNLASWWIWTNRDAVFKLVSDPAVRSNPTKWASSQIKLRTKAFNYHASRQPALNSELHALENVNRCSFLELYSCGTPMCFTCDSISFLAVCPCFWWQHLKLMTICTHKKVFSRIWCCYHLTSTVAVSQHDCVACIEREYGMSTKLSQRLTQTSCRNNVWNILCVDCRLKTLSMLGMAEDCRCSTWCRLSQVSKWIAGWANKFAALIVFY